MMYHATTGIYSIYWYLSTFLVGMIPIVLEQSDQSTCSQELLHHNTTCRSLHTTNANRPWMVPCRRRRQLLHNTWLQ